MTKITIEVQDKVAVRLENAARQRDMSMEQLVSLGVDYVLGSHQGRVKILSNRIIDEDRELLQRLA